MSLPTKALACASIAFLPAILHAQGCCGIGSSLVAGGVPTLERGTFLVQSGVDYSSAVNPSRYRTAATLGLAYGMTNRLTVSIRSPYAWFRSEQYFAQQTIGTFVIPETTLVHTNNGFGDGLLGAQFAVVPMEVLHRQELKTGLDLGLPWGPDRRMKDGVELPKNIQTGGGGFTAGGFVSYIKAFPAWRVAGAATVAGRLKFRNRRGEDPGDEASGLVSAIAGPFWRTKVSVALNYRTTGATIDANGSKETSTAGSRADLIPSLEFTFTEYVKTTAEAEIPVWRDTYQTRFGNTFGARASALFFLPVFKAPNMLEDRSQ